MVVNWFIEFDDNHFGSFFAGQIISGKVTLEADKPKHVKGVILEIKGTGHTSWSESGTNNKTRTYSANEDYLSSKTELMSAQNGMVEIAAGIHTFTFSSRLPLSCPSSFEGKRYGYIRYLIKVSLVRPWKFNQTYTKGFTVIKYMDINLSDPLYKEPIILEKRKTFCCGPCKSDPLMMELNLPYSGFVPGQNIPVSITITNDSNKPIESFEVELLLNVAFNAELEHKYDHTLVTQIKGPAVLQYTKKLFNYSLPIPATPPTDLTHSKLIQISYEVRLVAHVKGVHLKKEIKTPVTIGSIWKPQGLIQQQPGSSVYSERELMNAMALKDISEKSTLDSKNAGEMVHSESKVPPYNNWSESFPPPTYEEALHIPHAIFYDKNDYGDKDFIPKYPIFKTHYNPSDKDCIDGDKGTWM